MPLNPEAVADRIAADIAAGRHVVGSLLPGERPLCEALGVGRPLLREAIRLLAARGLVETRHGQGTRVVADRSRPVAGAFAGVEPSAADLLELRLAVETAVAASAARRRTARDLADLEALLAEAAITTDLERAAAIDVAFHARLAEAAGNPLFGLTLRPVSGLLRQDRPAGLRRLGTAAALADHRAILAAVRAGRPAAAAAAMRRHLERVASALDIGISR